jgi:hypothetical protein
MFRSNTSPMSLGSKGEFSLPPVSTFFLLGLPLDLEYGGDMFLRNVGLSPNCMVLQSKRPYASN